MATYRIHRMREAARQQFRWQPHASGTTHVKPKDYEPGETVEANSVYGAWMLLRETPAALQVGDLLESSKGGLYICKYVGFEEAQWVIPEPKSLRETPPESVSPGSGALVEHS